MNSTRRTHEMAFFDSLSTLAGARRVSEAIDASRVFRLPVPETRELSPEDLRPAERRALFGERWPAFADTQPMEPTP